MLMWGVKMLEFVVRDAAVVWSRWAGCCGTCVLLFCKLVHVREVCIRLVHPVMGRALCQF
jgi:hypothetical protein